MKERVNRLRTILVLKWYSTWLSIGSIAFGFYLYNYPLTISQKTSYEVITNILSSEWLALAFIVASLAKLLFIGIDYGKGKLLALSALIFLWTLVTVGFFLQHINGFPNGGWILTGVIVIQAWGISQRGNFHT